MTDDSQPSSQASQPEMEDLNTLDVSLNASLMSDSADIDLIELIAANNSPTVHAIHVTPVAADPSASNNIVDPADLEDAQAVAEYAHEIVEAWKIRERRFHVSNTSMSIQADVTPRMRG